MGDTILIRRGTAANLPDLQEGEPGFATDNEGFYIGDDTGTAESAAYIGGGVYVDALQYEPNTYTQATILAALTAIGTVNKVTLLLRPGNWVILTALAFPTNITVKMPAGAYFSGAAVTAGTITGLQEAYPEMFGVNTTPGTTDMSVALQAALNAAPTVRLLTTTYKITDTIKLSKNNALIGTNKFPEGYEGYGGSDGCKILFAPTSEKDLFDLYTNIDGSGYMMKTHISGIFIMGNTTTGPFIGGAVTFSRYAINSKAAYSTFENIGINQFQDGIYLNLVINNKYRDIYIWGMGHAGIYTSTSSNTTDTFTNLIVRESPWGAILRGFVDCRFIDCLWESLTVGGVNVYKDGTGVEFVSNYAEAVPYGAAGDNYGMFYLNHDGTAVAGGKITILGGYYGANTSHGSFVDVDYTSAVATVSVIGAYYTRYNNGIKASANTVASSVFESGNGYSSLNNTTVNAQKADGDWVIYNDASAKKVVKIFGQTTGDFINITGNGRSLADAASIELSAWVLNDAGMILVTMNDGAAIHETGLYSISFVAGATSVVKIVGTANTVNTATAGKLCVYPTTTSVIILNNLGATVNTKVIRIY